MTKNLENLVTQLQSMESSMISVMFDLATKLSSLSDLSFFLLVESQGKTKFTGNRHLADAYLMSNFSQFIESDGRDVEMQFEPVPTPKVVLTHKTSFANTNSQKRRKLDDSNLNLENSNLLNKRPRLTQLRGDDVIDDEASDLVSFQPDSYSYSNTEDQLDNGYNQTAGVSTNKFTPTDSSPNSILKNAYSHHNNNLVTIDVSQGAYKNGRSRARLDEATLPIDSGFTGDVIKEENDIDGNPDQYYVRDGELTVVSPSNNNNIHSLISGQHRQLDDDFEPWDVNVFLENSEKLKFITKINTASVVLDKESTEFKLLHSLIYELSKTAATFCPYVETSDPRTSQYFANVFDTFWGYVPFLQQLHLEGVLPGNKATSKYKNLKSLLRWKMQKNFGVLMKKHNIRCKT